MAMVEADHLVSVRLPLWIDIEHHEVAIDAVEALWDSSATAGDIRRDSGITKTVVGVNVAVERQVYPVFSESPQ